MIFGRQFSAPADPAGYRYLSAKKNQVAPISTNLILSYVAEHILDLPRSF